jgi:hypothetical protein
MRPYYGTKNEGKFKLDKKYKLSALHKYYINTKI